MTDLDREFLGQAEPNVVEQYKLPVENFCRDVKCCYNCSNWEKDPTLLGDYAWNFCSINRDTMSKFDAVCERYCGFAPDENLIFPAMQKFMEEHGFTHFKERERR